MPHVVLISLFSCLTLLLSMRFQSGVVQDQTDIMKRLVCDCSSVFCFYSDRCVCPDFTDQNLSPSVGARSLRVGGFRQSLTPELCYEIWNHLGVNCGKCWRLLKNVVLCSNSWLDALYLPWSRLSLQFIYSSQKCWMKEGFSMFVWLLWKVVSSRNKASLKPRIQNTFM